MTRRFSHSVAVPATVAQVFAVLIDPQALAERYAASGSEQVRVIERHEDGAGVRIVYSRVESASLPPPIAKLVRGAAQITQTDVWSGPAADGARHATWTVRTIGVAVDVGGEMTLRPAATGPGSVLTESGSVTAHLPLIGGAIEKLAVEQSAVKLRREWDWLAARLRAQTPCDG